MEGNIKEINQLNERIKELSIQLKGFRTRKTLLEEEIIKYMEESKLEEMNVGKHKIQKTTSSTFNRLGKRDKYNKLSDLLKRFDILDTNYASTTILSDLHGNEIEKTKIKIRL
jgi:polynucleotide 5'-kinase involved in rRNA processing